MQESDRLLVEENSTTTTTTTGVNRTVINKQSEQISTSKRKINDEEVD